MFRFKYYKWLESFHGFENDSLPRKFLIWPRSQDYTSSKLRTTIFSWNYGHTLKRIPHCYMLSLALLWCRNSMATLNRGWSCLQTHFTLHNLSSTKGSLAYSTDWLTTTHLALVLFAYYLSSLFSTVLFRKVRFRCRKFLFSIFYAFAAYAVDRMKSFI